MNTFSLVRPRSPRGFTLIELLTVIAIIAILAAILIPAVGAARNAANKAKTKSQFSQWATAMTSFKQEYGYYPVIAYNDRINGNSNAPGVEFSNALAGKKDLKGESYTSTDSPTSATLRGNTKIIAFYSMASSDLDVTGTNPVLVDAFGNSDIVVRVDTNGDGIIDNTDPAKTDSNGGGYLAGSSGWPTVQANNPPSGDALKVTDADANIAANGVRAGILFYSAGKGATAADIVTSWQ